MTPRLPSRRNVTPTGNDGSSQPAAVTPQHALVATWPREFRLGELGGRSSGQICKFVIFVNPLAATLKPQSNWPSYSNTVIGTLAGGGDRAGLQSTQAPPRCTKCNSPSINGHSVSLLSWHNMHVFYPYAARTKVFHRLPVSTFIISTFFIFIFLLCFFFQLFSHTRIRENNWPLE